MARKMSGPRGSGCMTLWKTRAGDQRPLAAEIKRLAGAHLNAAIAARSNAIRNSDAGNVLASRAVLQQKHPAIQYLVTGEFKVGGWHVR